MTWPWKLMCAILYMLPWVDVTEKTVYFIERFPAFHWTEYFTGALFIHEGSLVSRLIVNLLVSCWIGYPTAGSVAVDLCDT